jgi:hypothetical protein
MVSAMAGNKSDHAQQKQQDEDCHGKGNQHTAAFQLLLARFCVALHEWLRREIGTILRPCVGPRN